MHLDITDRHLTPADASKLGFDVRTTKTALIDLMRDEEKILAGFEGEARRHCRRAEKIGLKVEEAEPDGFAEEYYEQAVEAYAKHGLRPTQSFTTVRTLIDCLHPSGQILLGRVREPQGRSVATSISVGLNQDAFLWGLASLREFNRLNMVDALIWFVIRHWRQHNMRCLDLGGLDWEGGNYKLKYGIGLADKSYFRKSRNKVIRAARSGAFRAYYGVRSVRQSIKAIVRRHGL
jgi:hypothetical protein